MRNPRFVPKVNLPKQALDYAKEMDFKVTLPSHSPDGRYIVHTTNGPAMIPGLSETFMSVFGDDPGAADYYSALSELNRNEFINDEQNIEKYGSKDAAEMYYLDSAHKKIVEITAAQLEEAKKQEAKASGKKAVINGIIENKGVDPNNPDDKALIKDRYQSMVDEMIAGSNAETHETDLNSITDDGYESLDVEAKRYRIDNVAARSLMQNDLYQAANQYAMQTMEVKTEVDQYALKQFDHALSVARMGLEHEYAKKLDDYKTENQKELLAVQLLKELFPNGKKSRALPDGSDPFGAGYRRKPASPGGSALEVDIKGEDAKQVITSTESAKSAAEQVIVKGYEELTAIINTGDGKSTAGGLVMTPAIRKYYSDMRDELFGKAVTTTKTKTSGPEGESVLGLFWNTLTGLFTGDTGTEEYTTTSGGYLNDNNQLDRDLTSRSEYNDPTSPYSWQNTADRVTKFFESDPVGKYSVNKKIDINQDAGILGASSVYNTARLNYNNFIKAQSDNNSIVHDLVMGTDAKNAVLDEMSTYDPVVSDENVSLWSKIYGIDAPDPIKQHTEASLDKMVLNGRIMTLPEFEQVYANSPEARRVAERVMQETYKTQPGDQGGGLRYGYEEGVQQILETMRDDAEDVYEQYIDQFTMIYNQSNAAVNKEADKAGFKPLSHFYEVNTAGAGVQSDPFVGTIDAAYPGDLPAVDYFDFYNKIVEGYMGKDSDGIKVYAGLGNDLSEPRYFTNDPEPFDNNEGAFTTLQGLRTELLKGKDTDDKTRGIFDMIMHPIILNDPNKLAFSFSISPEYADDNTGTGKAVKFMNKSGREFTIVIDREKVPEVENVEMVKRLNQGPYTIAMRANNRIDLNDFPKGGNLTIKPTIDNSYVASGQISYIDENTLETKQTTHVAFMGPGQTLENFAQQQNKMLAMIHMDVANAEDMIKAMSPNLIRNPNDFNN
jgi:hypothetical protein